jgi:hypothetical protein
MYTDSDACGMDGWMDGWDKEITIEGERQKPPSIYA